MLCFIDILRAAMLPLPLIVYLQSNAFKGNQIPSCFVCMLVGRMQTLFVMNLHLEGSPYRPNDRISQLKSALSRLLARQVGFLH